MAFSSLTFLFYFLPVAVALYFAAPRRWKNGVLFVSGMFFYGWGEPKYLLLMLASIAQGYAFGILLDKYRGRSAAKHLLTASVLLSLLPLLWYKYANLLLGSFGALTGVPVRLLQMVLPIGISFYTFQILSYTVDVYRGEPAQKNPIALATYIVMFPQLIAGPIVRYSEIARQLQAREHGFSEAADGVRRFVCGMAKKVLLANVLGQTVDAFRKTSEPTVLFCWLYAVAFTLQIYYDFSGYSDMAIGLGRIFGFRFPENFNYPYVSASITEFWHRWHISLGSWFRDYLYIPLGGNRVGKARWLFHLLIVWAATGLWHGAAWNFVLWGLLFALLLIAEKLWLLPHLKARRVWAHGYVLLFVLLGFVIFDASSLKEAAFRLSAMFGGAGLRGRNAESLYALRSCALVLLLGGIGATPLPKKLLRLVRERKPGMAAYGVAEPLVLVVLLAVCTAFLVDGSFNPFLYFRF